MQLFLFSKMASFLIVLHILQNYIRDTDEFSLCLLSVT